MDNKSKEQIENIPTPYNTEEGNILDTDIKNNEATLPQEEQDYEVFDEERKKYLENLYHDISCFKKSDLIKGTIISKIDRNYIVDTYSKANAIIPLNELRGEESINIGDTFEFFVEAVEDRNGNLQLSRKKAKLLRAWKMIEEAYKNDTILEGKVITRTKGGFIVDIEGIETFLPGSQIDIKPIKDYDEFLGKTMDLKVAKINYQNNNVVVSHKVLIEKDMHNQREEILNLLEEGQVLEGFVKNITSFGVFIDLGGVDGLLHITDISWQRISNPTSKLEIGQKVKVIVIGFDEDKKRISLGMKQLEENPWDKLDPSIKEGSKVKGKITNITAYGGFLEVVPGVEGLVHISELSWSHHTRVPSEVMKLGDEMEAVILMIDRENKKMSLGVKQLSGDPWENKEVFNKYAPGTIHKGIVRNMTHYGLFLELEDGIDGLVHKTDISWTKKLKNPSEFISVGESLEVKVLEIDIENKKVSLGHKQLEENPWETFETIFTVGSLHDCTIIEKIDKGVRLELPYGIDGFCYNRALKKEDGSYPDIGDKLSFRVTDFYKDTYSIILSHLATYTKDTFIKKPNKTISIENINKKNTQATIGDLEQFSELRKEASKEKRRNSTKEKNDSIKDKSDSTEEKNENQ